MKLTKKIDVIKKLTIKEVWSDEINDNRIEEKCMSPFIMEHIDEIAKITGYNYLEVIDSEVFIGDFRADIICKDSEDNIIIIENQLGKSNHDHLGKSWVYLSNLNAKGIIWICETARPEHIKAVEFQNECTSSEYNFFLLELKFEKYNNQDPYYYFKEAFIPSLINKLANQIKNSSPEQIDSTIFFEKIDKALNGIIPINKYTGKSYTCIYNKSNVYALIKRLLRTNQIQFEFGSTDDNVKEKLDKVKNELNNTYNYQFNFELGKKNKNLNKYIYLVDNEDNIDLYKEICINMYNTIKNIIN